MVKDPEPLAPAPDYLVPKQPVHVTVTPTVTPTINIQIPATPIWVLVLLEIVRIWLVARGGG